MSQASIGLLFSAIFCTGAALGHWDKTHPPKDKSEQCEKAGGLYFRDMDKCLDVREIKQ